MELVNIWSLHSELNAPTPQQFKLAFSSLPALLMYSKNTSDMWGYAVLWAGTALRPIVRCSCPAITLLLVSSFQRRKNHSNLFIWGGEKAKGGVNRIYTTVQTTAALIFNCRVGMGKKEHTKGS